MATLIYDNICLYQVMIMTIHIYDTLVTIIQDRAEWYLDLDLVRHSSEARIALVPHVLIEDRPLLDGSQFTDLLS